VSAEEHSGLHARLAEIEEQITGACLRAGRSRGEVQLMAVSKMHSADAVKEAISAGILLFGENRVQEFVQKSAALADLGLSKAAIGARFHLIGHLQSNKAAKAAELFDSIDSVDSLRLAERLNDAAEGLNCQKSILLEMKLSHEETKTGLDPQSSETKDILERLPSFRSLKLRGLMTVPPYDENPEAARPYFRQLRELREQLAKAHPALDFSELSMGMSGDFRVAIEEGATTVRIGTALFGRRSYPR
jgi:PLP dependent protein